MKDYFTIKPLRVFFCVMMSVTINTCLSQNENNIWYFGCESGISFNGVNPTAISGGMICTNEGCSSICDSDGQLLFYTDGANVWNKNHEIMPNGSGLSGGWTSTQAALIVKLPGFIEKYYLFTTDEQGESAGLRYSGIDMSLGCGFGDIGEIKDSLIVTPVSEKLTAVLHENGKDYWIVTHIYGTNEFHSYLLTSSGLNVNPVISELGQTIDFGHYVGNIKSTNKGDKIAATFANGAPQTLQLFDFNNSTGILSNEVNLGNTEDPDYGVYGVEFSPNDRFLYVSTSNGLLYEDHIYQYDLLAGSPELINNSRTLLWTFPPPRDLGALQIGPDGKIYMASWNHDSLAIIEYPDSLGLSSSFIANGIYLGGNSSLGGLPSKPNSYGYPYIHASNFCFGTITYFSIISRYEVDSVLWNFGDPITGSENFSTSLNPLHEFSEPGIFEVEVIVYSNSIVDTVRSFIEIRSRRHNQILGNDTTLCPDQTLALEVESECGNIEWQDGSNSSIYDIQNAGEYTVRAVANGCWALDTILVSYIEMPELNLGNDTTVCIGDSIALVSSPAIPLNWQDNTNNSIYTVTSPGLYYASFSKAHCLVSDSVSIDFNFCSNPDFDVPNIFTPNGDGKNEVFRIDLPTSLSFVELSVVNRWGRQVFRSTNQDIQWDGSGFTDGIYYWVLVYTNIRGQHFTDSGSLQLIR